MEIARTIVIGTAHNFGSILPGMAQQGPGDVIRLAREQRGWSQDLLAKRVGVSQPAIKKIEDGDPRQSKFLAKIAQVLALDLALLDPSLNGSPAPAVPDVVRGSQLEGARDFPLYASAEGGPGQIIISSDPVDFLPRPA